MLKIIKNEANNNNFFLLYEKTSYLCPRDLTNKNIVKRGRSRKALCYRH